MTLQCWLSFWQNKTGARESMDMASCISGGSCPCDDHTPAGRDEQVRGIPSLYGEYLALLGLVLRPAWDGNGES
ncbi:uncharacterized protein RCC_12096 [Ramularia collo-cygni]|uniref:Uncharacterized protein n=1 Tax=Ramularia collo-cygni TaxID=112498 RepID=A0A2D3V5P1_9PEZI|nr:uncharacterized protein RCC_12096 [Ramularia collo-cygni]CZT15613.1 uncharacterized protein RCC_12096 [Ramularia collo-cygni]